MATPFATAGLLTATQAPLRRPGRWRAALLLAAAVGTWHAWLVDQLAPAAPSAGPPRPGQVQLRTLPATAPAPPPAAAGQAPAAPPAPLAPVVPRQWPTAPAATAVADAAAVPVADPPSGALPRNGPGVEAGNVAAADTDAVATSAGLPPPVYPTRLPAPARLHYSMHVHGQDGVAQLVWQHDGERYRLTLDGQSAVGRPLWMQASDGVLDLQGLAPVRFLDRRAGRRAQAANFERDASLPAGQIRYSGPPVQHPAWPGAQDRLSWLVQLVAILAAADAPPQALQLYVTDARGHAGLWQLQRQPDVQAATPWGSLLQQHWLREPLRPEGLRIELWLPASPDSPAGAWPLRLRMVVPRSGHVVELWRSAEP